MKKGLFLLCAILAFNSHSYSQVHDSGDLEIIPNIGYTSSYLNGENVSSSDRRGTVRGGIIGDYYFNDRWSIRTGLSYMSLGAKDSFEELKINYINIPINANWHFGKTRRWNLNFGLTPGFLIGANLDSQDVKESFESMQLGITYGIGYKIGVSENFSFLIDWQGLVGITKILKTDDPSWYNAAGSFNLGGVISF
ncbi:porin family protein [Reichenbachiella sp.]|uniref:porin family protein n=1 Tax=Reichenbachiella sp. TaxID=2184521 RepID=UPI003B5AA665